MSEVPELVASHLPEISAHFSSKDNEEAHSAHPSQSDVNQLVKSAMAPPLPKSEERPPQSEDFTDHLPISLEILTRLVNMHSYSISRPASLPPLLLLCSQYCPSSDQQVPLWSSSEHQLQASLLLSKLESIYKPLQTLLVDQDRKLLTQLLSLLQPCLEKFMCQPASVHSLAWLTSHISHPHLGQVVPQLLPHALNWLDCWVPYYKLFGCQVVGHIIATCPASELVWFGRADLLSDALKKLLHHADTAVVEACRKPLISVVSIKHDDTKPDKPGAADLFMKDLIGSLELTSDNDKKEIYSDMILQTVNMLGVGVARWVARLSKLIVSQLDFSPPASVFSLLGQLCNLCPGCVAREVPVILPALVKYAYRKSLRNSDASDTSETSETSLTKTSDVSAYLVQVATCDPIKARLLCHNLETVFVNKKFDTIIHNFLAELAVM